MTQARNHSPLHIPHSRAGRITDQVLDRIGEVADRAQKGITLQDCEASLILLTLPQICQELRQRRAAMDLISDCTDLENVHFLPCGG